MSVAGVVRRFKNTAAITSVLHPAGTARITAAVVERMYAEAREIACLYTDLRNPASKRCDTKIGFTPVCGSLHFHRNA